MSVLVEERTVVRRNDVSVKVDAEVTDECRIAAAFKGMTLSEYMSETLRIAAKRDIDEEYARRSESSDSRRPKPKGQK